MKYNKIQRDDIIARISQVVEHSTSTGASVVVLESLISIAKDCNELEEKLTQANLEIDRQRLLVQDYIGALEVERSRTGIAATPHGYKLVATGGKT